MITNPLLSNSLLAGSSLPFEEEPAERTFTNVQMKEGGDQQNLNNPRNVIENATYDDLQNLYGESKQLQGVFNSFDNYIDYMTQREDVLQSSDYFDRRASTEELQQRMADELGTSPSVTQAADWMKANVPGYVVDEEWVEVQGKISDAILGGYQLTADEQARYLEMAEQYKDDPTGGFNNRAVSVENMNSIPELAELNKQFGVPEVGDKIQTSGSGDQMTWTGTGYVKTTKVDDHRGTAANIIKAGIGAGAGALLGPMAAAQLGVGASTAASAALGNTVTQAITTGSIDPKSVLASALTAGSGLGNAVNELAGGINPASFLGGAVSGATNNLVTQAVVDGKVDLGALAQAGLVQGGINSVADFFSQAEQTKLDNQVKLYMAQGNSQADAVRLAMESGLVDTSSLGGLVGPDGLLAPLGLDQYADTSWLGDATDFLRITGPQGDMFQDADGNLFSENEIIAKGIDPSNIEGTGFDSVYVDQGRTLLGQAADKVAEGVEYVAGDFLDSASRAAFIEKHGFDPNDPANLEATKLVFATGGRLNERYTFTPEGFERGPDSTLYGITEGIDGKYSTGPQFDSTILNNPESGSLGIGTTYDDIGGLFDPTTVGDVVKETIGGPIMSVGQNVLPDYSNDGILSSIVKGVIDANDLDKDKDKDKGATTSVDTSEQVVLPEGTPPPPPPPAPTPSQPDGVEEEETLPPTPTPPPPPVVTDGVEEEETLPPTPTPPPPPVVTDGVEEEETLPPPPRPSQPRPSQPIFTDSVEEEETLPTPPPPTAEGGGGTGLLEGDGAASKFEPKWGELFQYTTLTPYQKKAVAPYVDYIKQARGMLS